MSAKPFERQLKIKSLSLVAEPSPQRKKVTTSSCQSHVTLTKSLFFFKVLVVFGVLVLSTNGMTILSEFDVADQKQSRVNKWGVEDPNGLGMRQSLSEACLRCFSSHLIEQPSSDQPPTDVTPEHRKQTLPIVHLPCDQFSYSRCLAVHQLSMKVANYPRNEVRHPTPLIDESRADEPRRQIAANEASRVKSSLQTSDRAKSRNKRLATGDRRLVHMYCRTHFVLEILSDGRVVGSATKTDNAILEIQAVSRGGLVRFYSPSTKHFLAMDNRGRLYGTKIYAKEHCAFIERIQENMWTTYSSTILPDKKKRKRRGRHRSKRSAKKAWYVAIGKTGKPRKANRIRPYQSSAQFLPRPLT